MNTVAAVVPTGILLPESTLQTDSFKILATFVALNTLMYATLAILKVLPKGYTLFWISGRNRRGQNRSIYPEPTPTQRRLWRRWAPPHLRVPPADPSGSGETARRRPG